MGSDAKQLFKEVTITAVVTRLDGTQEDLGTIAHTTFDEDGKQTDLVGKVEVKQSLLKKVLKKWQR